MNAALSSRCHENPVICQIPFQHMTVASTLVLSSRDQAVSWQERTFHWLMWSFIQASLISSVLGMSALTSLTK